MFETFVDPDRPDEEQLHSLIAYALYKKAKREWSTNFRAKHGRPPSEEQRSEYVATWSDTIVDATRSKANEAMGAFADAVVESAKPEILKEALEGSITRDVLVGMLSAFLYTVALIVAAWILNISGVDLVEVFKKIAGK